MVSLSRVSPHLLLCVDSNSTYFYSAGAPLLPYIDTSLNGMEMIEGAMGRCLCISSYTRTTSGELDRTENRTGDDTYQHDLYTS